MGPRKPPFHGHTATPPPQPALPPHTSPVLRSGRTAAYARRSTRARKAANTARASNIPKNPSTSRIPSPRVNIPSRGRSSRVSRTTARQSPSPAIKLDSAPSIPSLPLNRQEAPFHIISDEDDASDDVFSTVDDTIKRTGVPPPQSSPLLPMVGVDIYATKSLRDYVSRRCLRSLRAHRDSSDEAFLIDEVDTVPAQPITTTIPGKRPLPSAIPDDTAGEEEDYFEDARDGLSQTSDDGTDDDDVFEDAEEVLSALVDSLKPTVRSPGSDRTGDSSLFYGDSASQITDDPAVSIPEFPSIQTVAEDVSTPPTSSGEPTSSIRHSTLNRSILIPPDDPVTSPHLIPITDVARAIHAPSAPNVRVPPLNEPIKETPLGKVTTEVVPARVITADVTTADVIAIDDLPSKVAYVSSERPTSTGALPPPSPADDLPLSPIPTNTMSAILHACRALDPEKLSQLSASYSRDDGQDGPLTWDGERKARISSLYDRLFSVRTPHPRESTPEPQSIQHPHHTTRHTPSRSMGSSTHAKNGITPLGKLPRPPASLFLGGYGPTEPPGAYRADFDDDAPLEQRHTGAWSKDTHVDPRHTVPAAPSVAALYMRREDPANISTGSQGASTRVFPPGIVQAPSPITEEKHEVRRRWSMEELRALEEGMHEYKTSWGKIHRKYARPGGPLEGRDSRQLKDKARNERRRRAKEGLPLDIFALATN